MNYVNESIGHSFTVFILLDLAHNQAKIMIYANLAILATRWVFYWSPWGKSWTLRWLSSLLDKRDFYLSFTSCKSWNYSIYTPTGIWIKNLSVLSTVCYLLSYNHWLNLFVYSIPASQILLLILNHFTTCLDLASFVNKRLQKSSTFAAFLILTFFNKYKYK